MVCLLPRLLKFPLGRLRRNRKEENDVRLTRLGRYEFRPRFPPFHCKGPRRPDPALNNRHRVRAHLTFPSVPQKIYKFHLLSLVLWTMFATVPVDGAPVSPWVIGSPAEGAGGEAQDPVTRSLMRGPRTDECKIKSWHNTDCVGVRTPIVPRLSNHFHSLALSPTWAPPSLLFLQDLPSVSGQGTGSSVRGMWKEKVTRKGFYGFFIWSLLYLHARLSQISKVRTRVGWRKIKMK